MSDFYSSMYNPDVLTCLANLSNDEVFTPPEVANRMLLCISGFGLSKIVFQFVPMQDFSKSWTDEELYEKYGLTDDEITFIESMIKPMEVGGDDNGN